MMRNHSKQGIVLGIFTMLIIFYCTSMVEVKLGRRGINENLQEIYSQMQPPYEWERLLGGKGDDCFLSIQEAKNGYILAGYTCSDVKGNDGWLVKIDGDGRVMWEKKYGDYADDYVYWAEQTKEGGYIAAGKTYSYAYNSFMGWLLKVNENGEREWEKIFGGKSDDCFFSVHQTNDGGFILGGYTNSFGSGGADIWLLKVNENGGKEWEHIWGGATFDEANEIKQTSDGGYVSIFYYESFGFGDDDDWLYKLNGSGKKEWQKTFGGDRRDILSNIIETDDGYIMIGSTKSFGSGDSDAWLVKTDKGGNMLWNRTYGGEDDDRGYYVQQTDDGYIIVGYTKSFGSGDSDGWVIGTDMDGNLKWNETFGGKRDDCFTSLQRTDDGYIIVGYTKSFGSGDSDGWVIKISVKSPSSPDVSGDTEGFQWAEYTYNVSSIAPNDNKIKFYFDWGDGSSNWTDFVESGEIFSQPHIWENAGTYEVRVKAQDENGEESGWSSIQVTIHPNSKPDKPYKPQGPSSGLPSSKYSYTTLAYDKDGDDIQYGWDWNGDGIVDEWTSLKPSGESIEIQHSWNEKGNYEVRVISKDEHGAKGEWSDPLAVSIPYCLLKKFMELPLISFLRDLLLHYYIIH